MINEQPGGEEFVEYRSSDEGRNLRHFRFAGSGQHTPGPECPCAPTAIEHRATPSSSVRPPGR